VAVIDSGVNHNHPHISSVAGGIAIGLDPAADSNSYVDVLGHGTAVMAAIQEKAPGAQYFAVKLFHDSLRTSADHLLQAIEWAIDNCMDVINLSLGTRNPDHAPRFTPLLERAAANGIVLVSALEAEGHACFPGSLPGVAGVGVDWEIGRHSYRIENTPGSLQFYASGYPRSLPGVPRRRNLSGISFAVANMTGLIVRAREGLAECSLPALREALVTESGRIYSRAAL
jgi:subtilisin family serine protease